MRDNAFIKYPMNTSVKKDKQNVVYAETKRAKHKAKEKYMYFLLSIS